MEIQKLKLSGMNRVSSETVLEILKCIESSELKQIYLKTLPISCSMRLFMKKFQSSPVALAHASHLEKSFNLSLKDAGVETIMVVFNMYLIEISPNWDFPDFDWDEFVKTTRNDMKCVRNGEFDKLSRKLRVRKIYRMDKKSYMTILGEMKI